MVLTQCDSRVPSGSELCDEPSLFPSFLYLTVSNGVDTLRLPCSALNVKVIQNKRGQTTGVTMTILTVATSALIVTVFVSSAVKRQE